MDTLKKLHDLVKEIPVAMLTTRDENGHLRSRPMSIQQKDWDGTLWFFTSLDTTKVDEIHLDNQVNVSFAEPKNQTYVSVTGRAKIVQDREKSEALWSPLLKAWFPKGLDDPNLALLKVTIEQAEYWDAPLGTMVQLVGMAKAMLSGTPYIASREEHAKVLL